MVPCEKCIGEQSGPHSVPVSCASLMWCALCGGDEDLVEVQLKTEIPVFSIPPTPHHFQSKGEHEAFYTQQFAAKGREPVAQVTNLCV